MFEKVINTMPDITKMNFVRGGCDGKRLDGVVEFDFSTRLEKRGAQLDACVNHVVVAHGVEVELNGRVRVVIVVGTPEHLHHNLVRAKRESLEDNLSNQRLPSNKDAQALVVELQLGIQRIVSLIVGLGCVLQHDLEHK